MPMQLIIAPPELILATLRVWGVGQPLVKGLQFECCQRTQVMIDETTDKSLKSQQYTRVNSRQIDRNPLSDCLNNCGFVI
jgi:hypothetical protein